MNLNSEKKLKVRALWDTGATNTMVSKKVAELASQAPDMFFS